MLFVSIYFYMHIAFQTDSWYYQSEVFHSNSLTHAYTQTYNGEQQQYKKKVCIGKDISISPDHLKLLLEFNF